MPIPPDEAPSQGTGAGSEGSAAALGWAYAGATGPDAWATLSPEFQACAAPNQSPIDVPLEFTGNAETVAFDLGSLPLEATADGRGLRLGGASTMGLTVAGKHATLDHLALHAPAEHLLGGTRADLEVELAFARPGEAAVVVSLFLRAGQPNAALGALVGALPTSGNYEAKLLGAMLPLADLVPKSAQVLGYEGSFTTPPCAPALRLVVAQVLELSAEQLSSLKAAIGSDNARPVQPLGERKLTLGAIGPAPAAPAVSPQPGTSSSAAPPKNTVAPKNPAAPNN